MKDQAANNEGEVRNSLSDVLKGETIIIPQTGSPPNNINNNQRELTFGKHKNSVMSMDP